MLMRRNSFSKEFLLSRPFSLYVKVSEVRHLPVTEIIKNKFHPDNYLLIRYFHFQDLEEQAEMEKQRKEAENATKTK